MSRFADLIDSYLAGPAELRKAVAGMTRDQLVARPVPGKWSTLEVVAHIADFEAVLSDRMKRVLSHERPLLLVADENLFAATLGYQERDLEEELALIEATRKQTARVLRGVTDKAFEERYGVHSLKGLVSLEAVLKAAANHVPHHVKFIEEKRKALGA